MAFCALQLCQIQHLVFLALTFLLLCTSKSHHEDQQQEDKEALHLGMELENHDNK